MSVPETKFPAVVLEVPDGLETFGRAVFQYTSAASESACHG